MKIYKASLLSVLLSCILGFSSMAADTSIQDTFGSVYLPKRSALRDSLKDKINEIDKEIVFTVQLPNSNCTSLDTWGCNWINKFTDDVSKALNFYMMKRSDDAETNSFSITFEESIISQFGISKTHLFLNFEKISSLPIQK